MSKIDELIEDMGYEVREEVMLCNYIIYENKNQNQEVIIEWDDEDDECKIFSQTISKYIDWDGHVYKKQMPLTIKEAEIFVAKINEMRTED